MREKILSQFWTCYAQDDFDLTNSIRTNAEFSYAIAVMDRVGGWIDGAEEGSQIGARFAASAWIYTKAVIGNEKRHMEAFRYYTMNLIMEAINWVLCIYFQDDHDWISEYSLVMQENKILEALNYDIDVPCVVQWKKLWYSAPTSLNIALLNGGVIFAEYSETVNVAIEGSSVLPLWRGNTPRSCFLRAQ